MMHIVSQIRIAFWIAIGGISAALGAENWSSFHTVIVGKYTAPIPAGYYQDYTSSSSNSVPYICSGILFYDHPSYGIVPIGGFDVANGVVTYSYFSYVGEAYTANTGAGTNPGNIGNYSWEVYYDYNGDGILGTQLAGNISNRVEQLDASKFSITNFSPYDTSATFEFHMTDPTVVLPIGAISVNRVATTNVISLSVSTTGTLAGGLTFQYKNALTNTTWTLHSIHDIPTQGALISTVDTNTVPSRFYRAIAPK
jgi:hypothetical protein